MSTKLNDMTFRDLELRHLHALRAVANEGTFARAGQLLGFTQSAISQQISGLERAIGSPVFDRLGGARGAQLTPIGHLLLEHAHRILGSVETAEHALQSFQSGIDGSLVIGTFQSMSVRVLPAVLGRLRQEWPGLEIRLFESDEQSILTEQLRAGELDLTFAVYPLLGDDLAFEDLCEDAFVVLCPLEERGRPTPVRSAGSPRPVVQCHELSGVPLIGQPDDSCQILVAEGLTDQGVVPNFVFRSSDNGAVQAMVRAGMGRAVMPYLAIEPLDPEVIIADLSPPLAPRVLGLATRSGATQSPAALRFSEIAREVCTHVGGPSQRRT